MLVKPGEVYKAYRTDIEPAKTKYQLYIDKNTVLLINTKKSKYNISFYLQQKDCPILEYDSYICLDNIFKFEPQYKVLKIIELPTEVLVNLKNMVRISNLLTPKQIKHIEYSIALIIAQREQDTTTF